MKRLSPHRIQPRLEVLEERRTPSTSRPLSDFLSAQGTTSVFNYGVPGLPDLVGFGTSTDTFNAGTARFSRIDYTGQDAAFLNANFGLNINTTVSGTVSERPLKDGRAEVTVNLQTHNAFAWATTQDANFDPTSPTANETLLFGSLPYALAYQGATPALADVNLKTVFDISSPGAPLIDLVYFNGPPPGLVSLDFRATAQGTTPSGQSATLVVSQTTQPGQIGGPKHDFGFTAEVVDVHANGGNGPAAAAASQPATTTPLSPATASFSATDAAFASGLDDPLI